MLMRLYSCLQSAIAGLLRSQGFHSDNDMTMFTGHAHHQGLSSGSRAALQAPSARHLRYAMSCASISRYHVELVDCDICLPWHCTIIGRSIICSRPTSFVRLPGWVCSSVFIIFTIRVVMSSPCGAPMTVGCRMHLLQLAQCFRNALQDMPCTLT